MIKVIGVRFRTAGKIYFFDPVQFDVKRGDHVIVETARGVEYGTVVCDPKEVEEEQLLLDARMGEEYVEYSEERKAVIEEITERRVRAEVKRGVQTIQYQVNTLLTTNGQAPFITVFMYLNEVEDEQTKKDLAMIIEEVLLQRHEGVKNEKEQTKC